jgi:phosphoglycolate phosphatase
MGLQAARMRAVLFDFDFTLADSSAGVVECFAHGFERVGLPDVEAARVRRTIGLTLDEALRVLHGVEDPIVVRAFFDAFRERAADVMVAKTRFLERAIEAVRACRDAGLATAICSTKKRSHIEGVLERDGVTTLFDVVIGHDDVPAAKPAPDALHAALARLDVGTDRALYVGDHPVDAEAAARAGVAFVAVLTGPSRREEFGAHAVREFLASIDEVPRALRALSKR